MKKVVLSLSLKYFKSRRWQCNMVKYHQGKKEMVVDVNVGYSTVIADTV